MTIIILPPPLPDLARLIRYLSASKPNRDACSDFLEEILPIVKKYKVYWDDEKNSRHQRFQDPNFMDNLRKIQNTIMQDFYLTKATDWIEHLFTHGLSLITRERVTLYLSQFKVNFPTVSTFVSKRIQDSQNRRLEHLRIFKVPVKENTQLYFPADLPKKIRQAILKLTASHSIINNIVYHWTTLANLQSILRNKFFYGNGVMLKNKLSFEKNALGAGDIENGDQEVICFCPALVHSPTLFRNNKIRSTLVRLTLNLDHAKSIGQCNQFFKLSDFFAEFSINLKINDQLTVHIIKSERPEIKINIILKGKEYLKIIPKQEIMFYGNLYAINRFCLNTILEAFSISAALKEYLESLSVEESSKMFILVGQALTMYAEYNFNKLLPLSDFLIQEIYYTDNNTLSKLATDNSEAYHKDLAKIANNQMSDNVSVLSNPIIKVIENDDNFLFSAWVHDFKITRSMQCFDFSQITHQQLLDQAYVETRFPTFDSLPEEFKIRP